MTQIIAACGTTQSGGHGATLLAEDHITSIARYVNSQYNEILHRHADVEGLMHYTDAIYNGELTRLELVDILSDSDELKGVRWIDSDAEIELVSTYGIHCGIATYTAYLMQSLSKICNVGIFPVNDGVPPRIDFDGVLVYQHEFGIFGDSIPVSQRAVVAWHTVLEDHPIPPYADAHIVHSPEVLDKFPEGSVHFIPHGTMVFDRNVSTWAAREALGLPQKVPIILIFGFRTPNKSYDTLLQIIEHAHRQEKDIMAIFTAAPHGAEDPSWGEHFARYQNSDYVRVLHSWLSEEEVSLYALASSIFLFNYAPEPHYSASGAMHRIIGAGKPVVCSRNSVQFRELEEDVVALKFDSVEEAAEKIVELIRSAPLYQRLKQGIIKYAERTSWDNVAKEYLKVCQIVKKRK